uniref:MalT-like TPR region domain-containing protein n=1 Tax=Spongospora subterranea TaxID=70186 RepID=A0A0H5QWJ1_9EUKA|eukprot:CRZ06328.1 hypothetical protein [Spongospora subterranea]
MSSHSKSAAIIGLDSSMGFNHAALMFGGHSRHSKKMSISSKKRQSSPRLLTKKVLDPELEDVDMTPPEERLAKFSVLAVEYEERHDFEQLVTARMHCLALAQLCFGKTHPEVTLSHLRLGNAFQRRGLFVQAEQHAQTALDRLTSIDHGEKESKRIRFGALSTVGCAGIGLRQWAKAEPLLQQAQDLVEYASGASDKANLMLALSQVQTQVGPYPAVLLPYRHYTILFK